MLAGSSIPCQWIDASWSSVLATRSVTTSPSFQRRVGAGTDPFTVKATRGLPVKFIGVSPMRKSKSAPDSSLHGPGAFPPCANAELPHGSKVSATPLTVRPLTKVRRDTVSGEDFQDDNGRELIDPQFLCSLLCSSGAVDSPWRNRRISSCSLNSAG